VDSWYHAECFEKWTAAAVWSDSDFSRMTHLIIVHGRLLNDYDADMPDFTKPESWPPSCQYLHLWDYSVWDSVTACLPPSYPRKGKEDYQRHFTMPYSPNAQAWITQFTCKLHCACLSFVSIHQMAPPLTEVANIHLQLTNLSTPEEWKAELAWLVDL